MWYYIIITVIISGILMVRDKCGQQMGEYFSQIFICRKSFLHMYLLFEFLEATVIISHSFLFWMWQVLDYWEFLILWRFGTQMGGRGLICLQRKLKWNKGGFMASWPRLQMLPQRVALGSCSHVSGISFWASKWSGSKGPCEVLL